MMRILFTILTFILITEFTSAQHEITINYRKITFFNPLEPGEFSLETGDIKVNSHTYSYNVGLNNSFEPDSMYMPFDNDGFYFISDTIDLPAGKTELSFEWKFNSLNIANVLRTDSVLKIEHQIYDVDLDKVIAVPMQARIKNEAPVYDTSTSTFRRKYTRYGTRSFEINLSKEHRVVFRIKINTAEMHSPDKIKCYTDSTSISYDDSSDYFAENPFAKFKLPNEVTNIITEPADTPSIPKNFILYQNYPDPFNPMTAIEYSIPSNSYVILKVYNLIGQLVADLVDGIQNPGDYSVTFDGSNLPSGIYLDVFQARSLDNNQSVNLVSKMILMK